MSPRAFPFRFDEAADLEEARARSHRLTLDERFAEAVAMYIVSLVDIAQRSTTAEEFTARLDRDPPGCPADYWRDLQLRRASRATE